MSWHCSLALVEEFSAHTSLDGALCARLKTARIARKSLCDGKKRGIFRHSPSGTTLDRFKAGAGVASWMWSLLATRAHTLQRQRMVQTPPCRCGVKPCGSSTSASQPTSCEKTSSEAPKICPHSSVSCEELAMSRTSPSLCPPPQWVQAILGTESGYLHTPTAAANMAAPSMQKHAGCRRFVKVFGPGKPTPATFEWMMGWPIGWTGLEPLEMGKFQTWLLQHGGR